MQKLIYTESFRYVLAGGLNTFITYVFYLLLLFFASYEIAYSVAFAVGIVTSYTLNTLFVFRQPWTWRKLFQFPIVNLVQYALGLFLLAVFVDVFHIDEKIAPLISVVLLMPLTFLLSKIIVKHGA